MNNAVKVFLNMVTRSDYSGGKPLSMAKGINYSMLNWIHEPQALQW